MTADPAFAPIALHAANPGLMTGLGNWTYLLVSSGSAALIDAGVGRPEHLADVRATLGAHDALLQTVILTHGHGDHVAGAPAIQAAYPGVSFLKYPWPDEDGRLPVAPQPLADQQRVAIGETSVVALHTPGHSPDHCVLWHEPSRTVFTGDLIIPGGSVVIHTGRGGDMQAYLASLDRVLAMGPTRLLPAHGPPVERPQAVLATAIEHRLERERQVLAAVEAGYATVASITESIYHGLPRSLMPLAVENVRAHLDKLRREERLPCAVSVSAAWFDVAT